MPLLPPIRLTGARVLRDGALHDTDLTVADGQLSEDRAPDVDLSGYLVLPGIVDLHGDGFERHLSPRPTAPFEKAEALRSAAAELAANGVTTAWFAQSWSWEGGFRAGTEAEAILAALDRIRPRLLPDVRLQIRLETHVLPEHPRVLDAVRRHGVDYIVFNNHLPEAVDLARDKPDRFAAWAAQHRRTPEEQMARVTRRDGAGAGGSGGAHPPCRRTPRPRRPPRLARRRHARDARLLPRHRRGHRRVPHHRPRRPRGARGGGAHAHGRAERRARRQPVGQHRRRGADGRRPLRRARVGLLLPRARAGGVAARRQRRALLRRRVGGVSTAPARIAGLADRGALAPGQRADLVVVDPGTRTVEATIAGGRMAHLSGGAAQRFMGSKAMARSAAAS